jgi:hypothetical protein
MTKYKKMISPVSFSIHRNDLSFGRLPLRSLLQFSLLQCSVLLRNFKESRNARHVSGRITHFKSLA